MNTDLKFTPESLSTASTDPQPPAHPMLRQVNLVMEFCENGDLDALIKLEHPLTEKRALQLLYTIAAALKSVHAKGRVHRDVKPANVLVSGDGRLKLGDFGLTRLAHAEDASRGAGTLRYMSPEAFNGERPSSTDDIWSLGIIAVTLASGCGPKEIISPNKVESLLSTIPPNFSAGYHAAARQMLQTTPQNRPSAEQLLKYPLLTPFASHSTLEVAVGSHKPPTQSIVDLDDMIERASWIAPSREPGLTWEMLAPKVKVCPNLVATVDATTPEQRAAQRLLDLIHNMPGNTDFAELNDVRQIVLCDSRYRTSLFLGQVIELNNRLDNRLLFDLSDLMVAGSSEEKEARQSVLQRYMETYPTLCVYDPVDNVRVWIAFHAVPSEDVAKSILKGGFAPLQQVDAGYFGKGVYMTLDAKYAIEEYGVRRLGFEHPAGN